jgi:hypothetical protein
MVREHYTRLLVMAALSFAFMYVLMYAMVDRFPNALTNLNQLYMAGLMAAPMVVIELHLMREMYQNRRLNMVILAGAVVAAAGFFTLIRAQVAISDEQFLKSMIPHHAGAILMCEEADVEDPDVLDLCGRIVASQEAEIAEMRAKLAELGGPSTDADAPSASASASTSPSGPRSVADSRTP